MDHTRRRRLAGDGWLGIPEAGFVFEAFRCADESNNRHHQTECKRETRQNPEDCECGLHVRYSARISVFRLFAALRSSGG